MDERSRHRQFEDRFLRQLQTRGEALLHWSLPADNVKRTETGEGAEAVRAVFTRLGKSDHGLLDELPGRRTLQLRFMRRVFGPLRRTVLRVRGRVLAPIEDLLEGDAPGPMGRDDVETAQGRYLLMPERERPDVVVFASATGFSPEARTLVQMEGGPQLVLLGGREDGGWDVTLPDALRGSRWAALFELESQDERLKRLLQHLDQQAGQLESSGIPMAELAEQLGLTPEQTTALVRQACRSDSRLLTVTHEGTILVCRSPLADEDHTMSLWSRIRKLLRLKPTPAERVRLLTVQRTRLEQQRRELDTRLEKLEAGERAAVEQGAAAKTDVERKQLAGKLMRARRELRRVRAQANVLTQQIEIIGTHIHHQTLTEQGKRVTLPKAEELTQQAAEAEQVMAELAANADLAASIEVGAESALMAEEEAAIFEEFKQAAVTESSGGEAEAPEAAPNSGRIAERTAAPEVPRSERARDPSGPEAG